jgi:fructokinase
VSVIAFIYMWIVLISSNWKCVGDSNDHASNMKGANDSLVVCFGEMLIDFVPTVAGVSLAEAPAFKKAPGGAPANVAVGISRLGGSSAYMGKVHLNMVF